MGGIAPNLLRGSARVPVASASVRNPAGMLAQESGSTLAKGIAQTRLQNDAVLIIGIDCATQNKNVGVAIGRCASHEGLGSVLVEEFFLANDKNVKKSLVRHLVSNYIAGHKRVLLALDAPLGWPDAMRTELGAHTAGRPLATGRQRMFSRLTDRFVQRRTGKKPLDVGANLIAKTAHWALKLLERIRDATGEEIPLLWDQGQVCGVAAIEVYPALALSALAPANQDRRTFGAGYRRKGEPGCGPRRDIWDQLKHGRIGGLCDEPPETDDEIDAVLCVHVAHQFLWGACVPRPAHLPADAVRREGWIWFPRDSCLPADVSPN